MTLWRALIGVGLAAGIAASGCSGDNARELFDTAQFEERQNNAAHAKQLYRELSEKYPQSPYAARAAERLRDMDAPPKVPTR